MLKATPSVTKPDIINQKATKLKVDSAAAVRTSYVTRIMAQEEGAKSKNLKFCRGPPYMTSAVAGKEGGPQKADNKEQNQLLCVSDGGGGVKKSENFADVIYGSPLGLGLIPSFVS